MFEITQESAGVRTQRQLAVSRWDDEGGTGPDVAKELKSRRQTIRCLSAHRYGNCAIARARHTLENLAIALLAYNSNHAQLTACEMVDYILPKPGATQHWLTIYAASHMIGLLERSKHFQIG